MLYCHKNCWTLPLKEKPASVFYFISIFQCLPTVQWLAPSRLFDSLLRHRIIFTLSSSKNYCSFSSLSKNSSWSQPNLGFFQVPPKGFPHEHSSIPSLLSSISLLRPWRQGHGFLDELPYFSPIYGSDIKEKNKYTMMDNSDRVPQSLQTWWDEYDCMNINMSHKTVMSVLWGGALLAETSGDTGEAQLAGTEGGLQPTARTAALGQQASRDWMSPRTMWTWTWSLPQSSLRWDHCPGQHLH